MPLPAFNQHGDLPVGVYPLSLAEALARFGAGSSQRQVVARRLEQIYRVARTNAYLARFVVFGSFITAKPAPNDVDVFMLMDDEFAAETLAGEAKLLFDHAAAQAHFGASVFWLRRQAAFGGEQATIEYWQVKRGGGQRGIIEILSEQP